MNTRKRKTSACVGVVMAVVTAALFAGGGCASKPQVLPASGRRNPAPPDSVTIYQKQPRKYEVLGEVTASREEGARWDDQGNANAGFDTLKQKAALLGANGLLLDPDVIPHTQRIQTGYHDHYYRVAARGTPGNATAAAQAIYVHDE